MINKEYLNSIEIIPLLDTLKLQKISDEEYFSEKYNGYISNSRLSLINPNQDNDPKAFFEGLTKHSIYSDALIFGSAVHELTLQPELFHLCTEVDRPTAKAGFMADILYETGWDDEALINASNKVNYYKDKFDDDKKQALIDKCKNYWETRKKYEEKELDSVPIYLDPKNRDRLAGCIKALNDNSEIQKLLHPEGFLETPISENEQAILVDVQVKVPDKESFILRIKAKLDNYTIDKETNQICVNDVKTIGKIVSEFPSNFEKFRYCRELSLYSWLLSLCAKKFYKMDNPTIKSNCLVVSTIPSYYTSIYKVTNKDFTEGWNEFNFLLKLVAHYKSIGYEFV